MIELADPPTELVDARGGTLVLRGTNVSGDAKRAPDRLATLGAPDLAWMREQLGLDAIRLVVFWEAIEPAPGRYDERYLAAIRERVVLARAHDLHVVVDMHQDLFGRAFGHAGAPSWAVPDGIAVGFRAPRPWMLGYLTPEVAGAFDALYAPGPLRAAFVAAWTRLARALAGAGVLAYDLLNEPGWGTATPEAFDREIAPGLYAELVDAIRAVDPSVWIALEPAPTASLGMPSALVAPARERLVYAPHAYAAALELGHASDPSRDTPETCIRTLARDARRLGLPLCVGELGVRRDVPGAARFIADAYAALDAERASAMQWDFAHGDERSYSLCDPTGATTDLARAIARPYPRRVAGRPQGWAYDAALGTFTATWSEPSASAGVTRIVLPKLAFPDGVRARVDGGPWATTTAREVHILARGADRLCEVERVSQG